ncbi:hypothetical protein F4803DRAFT_440976 [Xylaria telfairii]|nr:hypothetical protein F4803DRAFT_440976 [Xylaria telfairii]
MNYHPEYDNRSFRFDQQNFQPPIYRRSSRRKRKERQQWLFVLTAFSVLLLWLFRSRPSPPPVQDEAHAIPPAKEGPAGQTTPFWNDYRELVTAVEDYDDWFTAADAATGAIDTMWAKVVTGGEWRDYHQRLISLRAKQLETAHTAWTKFLDNRERVIVELVGYAGALWRVYVDGHPLNDTEAGDLNKRWVSALAESQNLIDMEFFASEKKAEEKDGGGETSPLDEDGFAALRFSARRITEALVRTHDELFKDLDVVYKHIQEAEGTDSELKDLTSHMGKSWYEKGFWSTQMAISVSTLKRRVEKLQGKRVAMATWLKRLQKQFPEDIENSPEKIVDRTAWLDNAKELLREWVAALLDVQEGVLFLLRRRELPREQRLTVNYIPTWEAWKGRNCGGTSCYNAPGVMANFKTAMHKGKPVARVARDESEWIRRLGGDGTPRVWRGVYDKACCQTSMLRDRIQHGSNQPPVGSR